MDFNKNNYYFYLEILGLWVRGVIIIVENYYFLFFWYI